MGDTISSDQYTDPQIHTYDGAGFGQGNLGKKGFEKFLDSHKCNAICQYLGLQPINPKSEKNDFGTFPRPELDLEGLDNSSTDGGGSSANPSPTPGTTPPNPISALAHHGNTMSSEAQQILMKRKSWGWGEREREREKEREEEEMLMQLRKSSMKVCFTFVRIS